MRIFLFSAVVPAVVILSIPLLRAAKVVSFVVVVVPAKYNGSGCCRYRSSRNRDETIGIVRSVELVGRQRTSKNPSHGSFSYLAMSSSSAPGNGNRSDNNNDNESKREFDEVSYERNRLARDAEAMNAMKAVLAQTNNGKEGDSDDNNTTARDGDGDDSGQQQQQQLRSPWKWKLRQKTWDYMEKNDIARFPRPVHHRIPNFVGADTAASNLCKLPEFQSSNIVKVNPDTPQRRVRHEVLERGKTLLTPQPRLRTGFFSTLSMASLPSLIEVEQCTSSKGVAKNGTPVTLNEEYTVDMVVVGSTAVCPITGARVGKGEGFAELEWGILSAQGNIDAQTCPVVTTVHDCQVIENEADAPEGGWALTKHDVPVDIIVTPTRVIRVPNRAPKPSGIFWDLLSPQKLGAIRVLRQLKKETEEKLGKPLPSGPEELLPPLAARNNNRKKKGGGNNNNNNKKRGKGANNNRRNRSQPKQQPPANQ